jgi:hypothetical protein
VGRQARNHELVIRYADAVTRGDWDAFESVWAPEGVWEEAPPMEAHVEGGRAIRERVATSMEGTDFYVQMIHGVDITLYGDGRASARTHLHGIAKAGDNDFEN